MMKKIITLFIICLYGFGAMAQDEDYLLPVFKGEGENRKFGYIDKTGKLVVDYKYDYTSFFSEGMAIIMKKTNGKKYWGFINTKGKQIIACKYDNVGEFSEGLAYVKLGEQSYFINKTGKKVIKLDDNIDYAYTFSQGLCSAKDKLTNKYGFINKNGQFIIAPQFDDAHSFSESLCAVEKNNKWGFINQSGKLVIGFQFDYVDFFSEGLCAVEKNDKWGFINTYRNLVIDYQFIRSHRDHYTFLEGLCGVKYQNSLWGYIDKNGDDAFPHRAFLGTGDFYKGRSVVVTDDNQTEIINKKGKTIKIISKKLDENYMYIRDKNHLFLDDKGNYFHIDYNGNIIWQGEGEGGSSAGAWICFPQNSFLSLFNGEQILIKNLEKGMEVLSYNDSTQTTEYSKVKELIIHQDRVYHLTRLTFINSQTLYANKNIDLELLQIEGTANHPILTNNGYQPLGSISAKDEIFYFSEAENKTISCRVLQVEKDYRSVDKVYNVHLENNCSYIVNHIVASPKCPFILVKHKGNYQEIDEILKNQVSKQLDKYDAVEIPFEMINNHRLEIKILEKKDEISYLDHIYLQVDEEIILPDCSANILKKINKNDEKYFSLKKGDFIEIKFSLPKGITKNSILKLVAKGYYELD